MYTKKNNKEFKIVFNELRWLESHKTLKIETIPICYQNERRNLNDIENEWFLEWNPFKELSFFIWPGLKLISMNEGIIFNTLNWYNWK